MQDTIDECFVDTFLTSFGTCGAIQAAVETNRTFIISNNQIPSVHIQTKVGWRKIRHLVNGESDGEEVGPHLSLFSSVLLHQGHYEGADHLVVVRVVVLLQQAEAVLRVGPEGVCRTCRTIKCSHIYME